MFFLRPTVYIVLGVLFAYPGTADPDADASGLSNRFPENRPYLNFTIPRNSSHRLAFDMKTGDLLTSPTQEHGKVVSSVRLLIQVINGSLSMSNKTVHGTGSASAAGVRKSEADHGEDDLDSSGYSIDDDEEYDEESKRDDDDSEDMSHISDESGERVNISLGRDNGGAAHGRKDIIGEVLSDRGGIRKHSTEDHADSAEVVHEGEEDKEEEEKEEDDGNLESDASSDCDCDEECDCHAARDENSDSVSDGVSDHNAERTSAKHQKIDLEHSVEAAESDEEEEEEERNDKALELEKDRVAAAKKDHFAAAVVEDTHQNAAKLIPPLRRKSAKKVVPFALGNHERTSTVKSAELLSGDEVENEEEREFGGQSSDTEGHTGEEEVEGGDTLERNEEGSIEGGKKKPVCFGDWTNWTACKAVNQSHSVRERARFKLLSEADPVPEMNLQSQSCEDSDLALVSGMVSEWSSWSDCSRTCDGGFQVKFRALIGQQRENAPESLTEKRPCGHKKCIRIVETPIFRGAWSLWSSCSRTCGGGIQSRYMQCILVSSAQYVADPNGPVLENVAIAAPRPVPRHLCITNQSIQTEGIEVTGCAVQFCAGDYLLIGQRYETEVLFTTTKSPSFGYMTVTNLLPSTQKPSDNGVGNNIARLVPSEQFFDSDHDESTPANANSLKPYPGPTAFAPLYPAPSGPLQFAGTAPYLYPVLAQAALPGRPVDYSGPPVQLSQQYLPLQLQPASSGPQRHIAIPCVPCAQVVFPGRPMNFSGPPPQVSQPNPVPSIIIPQHVLPANRESPQPPQVLNGGSPPLPPLFDPAPQINPAPPMAYQTASRYISYATAAPVGINLLRRYQEENQVDYQDYDERT